MVFSAWMVWVVVAILFIILEIFTAGFAVMCFSLGAAAAAICDACHLGLVWQLAAFALFSALALAFIRPAVIKMFYKDKTNVKTNGDAMVGRTVRVTETIDPENHVGCVSVDGSDWRAVSEDGSVIEKGNNVEIVKRDSIILTVRTKAQE